MSTTRFITIPEIRQDFMRLGRHVAHDQRSHDYPADLAKAVTSVVHQAVGLPLDQGQVGSCTAEALCGALNSSPDHLAKTFTQPDALHLYTAETQLEGKPFPQFDPGGTGLYVCKAAKKLGWIQSYKHAFGIDQALKALVIRPVITGISWLTSFDTPDPNGLVTITPRASVRGGHEIVADEIDADKELVGFFNSWSKSWGLGGRFYMSFATWDRLLQEQGDVTVPVV